MYHNAYKRPVSYERAERLRIPRDEGRVQFLQATFLITSVVALAFTVGIAVSVPGAVMLNNICASIKCGTPTG